MIRNFSDHAANERTFLAWLRTGVSIIAFGFVVEKFNIFLATLATVSLPANEAPWILQRQLSQGAFTRFEGLALMGLGVTVIAVSALRFVRIKKKIDADGAQASLGVAPELGLAALLGALTLAYCVHVFL